MKVIIVGCGKVGFTIARSLSAEKNVHVTVVANNQESIEKAQETIDVMFVRGNGLSENTLVLAGAKDADLIISVTNADETNILCCISAKHLGTKYTIARVRDPEYALELNELWKELGIDMVINPEQQTAREISRLLRYPSADDIDTFVGGRVELVSFKVQEAPEFFIGKSVKQIFYKKKTNIILAMVERKFSAVIPNGELVFEENDIISVLGRPSDIMNFFALIGKRQEKINNIMIIGGSKITHYLVELLNRHTSRTEIKIVEKDKAKCDALCETLCEINPRCLIINGDGTDEDFLLSEDIESAGAVICLTDRDEENILISLYALQIGIKKAVAKINHINQSMIKSLKLGSILNPQNITADQIVRYVRGLTGAEGSNIITMYGIFDNEEARVEAIEFIVSEKAKCLETQLKDLKLKQGVLFGCIVRDTSIIIPTGESSIQKNDRVIIITKMKGIQEIDDILS